MSDSQAERGDKFLKQARGYAETFFVYFDRKYGFKFSCDEERTIVKDAFRDTANHIHKHRIFQRTLDGLKLTSFLAFHAALLVARKRSHGGSHDPVREACQAGIERLSALLKLETSSEISLSTTDRGYLMSMFYAELTDSCDAGIGANGLSTVFTFLNRIRPDPNRLDNL